MGKKSKTRQSSYAKIAPVHGVVTKESHDFMVEVNAATVRLFSKHWKENLRENVKNGLWKKHGPLHKDCLGLGMGKAFVGIGAGRSFHANSNALQRIMDTDGRKNWGDRNFVFGACNHQLKPLLKEGMIPDMVFLVDASDVTYPQLCEGIPDNGKNTTLVVPLQASPKVLNEWDRQGRPIRFYASSSKPLKKAFVRATGLNSDDYSIINGGNVLNSMTSISAKVFGCDVFMGVANDLCFAIDEDLEKQKKGYYADGDYSSNDAVTGTGRNEASCQKKWLSFKLEKTKVLDKFGLPKLSIVGGDIVGTSHTLWVYKTWMEEAVMVQAEVAASTYHYYNCTEGGILGVMAKSTEDAEMKKDENWYMLDEVCKRWHTTTLDIAARHFVQAKEMIKWRKKAPEHNVLYARDLVPVV